MIADDLIFSILSLFFLGKNPRKIKLFIGIDEMDNAHVRELGPGIGIIEHFDGIF